jgi:hypothetical protein
MPFGGDIIPSLLFDPNFLFLYMNERICSTRYTSSLFDLVKTLSLPLGHFFPAFSISQYIMPAVSLTPKFIMGPYVPWSISKSRRDTRWPQQLQQLIIRQARSQHCPSARTSSLLGTFRSQRRTPVQVSHLRCYLHGLPASSLDTPRPYKPQPSPFRSQQLSRRQSSPTSTSTQAHDLEPRSIRCAGQGQLPRVRRGCQGIRCSGSGQEDGHRLEAGLLRRTKVRA